MNRTALSSVSGAAVVMPDGTRASFLALLAIIVVPLMHAIGAAGRGSKAAMAYKMAGDSTDDRAFDAARPRSRLNLQGQQPPS